jgi:glutamate-1-semialdehyde 2,1-aminomutase
VPGSFNLNLGLAGPVRSWQETTAGDGELSARLTTALQERGVRAMGGGHWYVSAAHTDDLVEQTVDAFEDALRAAVGA